MGKTPKPLVGISSCLAGNNVRYDGTNRFNRSVIEGLSQHVDWIVVCPEADAGLGVPRETIHLVGTPQAPRVLTTKTCVDKTDQLRSHSRNEVASLKKQNIAGFILKARSPSCGKQVPLTLPDDSIFATGQGIFMHELQKALPDLPIATEEELQTPDSHIQFLNRVRQYTSSHSG